MTKIRVRDGDAIVRTYGGRRYAKGWSFHCPVPSHADRHASCFMWRNNGALKCFAGCSSADVGAALDAAGFTATVEAKPLKPDDVRQEREAAIKRA